MIVSAILLAICRSVLEDSLLQKKLIAQGTGQHFTAYSFSPSTYALSAFVIVHVKGMYQPCQYVSETDKRNVWLKLYAECANKFQTYLLPQTTNNW